MAIVRVDLEIPELEDLLACVGTPERGSLRWRTRRKLRREFERGKKLEAQERADVARMRRNRRAVA